MASMIALLIGTSLAAFLLSRLFQGIYNLTTHPLAQFPGPRIAAASEWYKTWQEVFLSRSWIDVLYELHGKYGEVVRVGPNELHFSNPSAFMDIYNNSNRWDKEGKLYRCFGEDRSSFGYLTYREAKQRKDVMAPLFSKRATIDLQDLVHKNLDRLCKALAARDAAGKSSDMVFGLRCFTLDTITQFCFAKDVEATSAPDFQAPIVVAMDASLAPFVVFRNFELVRKIVFSLPGWFTKMTTPPMAGLVDLQEMLGAQVKEVVRNPSSLDNAPHAIVYHRLLDPELNKATGVPVPGSLYEEAQGLLFGGADSAANTLAAGTLQLLSNPSQYKRLKEEITAAWPSLHSFPKWEELEKLPYLTAVIQESLRTAPGVPGPLLRVVPPSGARIGNANVPGGTTVGMTTLFVHRSSEIFTKPNDFDPERWLGADSSKLEKWIVSFSKGPRSCLGQNLAMCELYLGFAHLLRRFDLKLEGAQGPEMPWKEAFLPFFAPDKHLRLFCKPVEK